MISVDDKLLDDLREWTKRGVIFPHLGVSLVIAAWLRREARTEDQYEDDCTCLGCSMLRVASALEEK